MNGEDLDYSLLAEKFMQVVDSATNVLSKDPKEYEEIMEMYAKVNKPKILAPGNELKQLVIQYGQMAEAYQQLWHAVENGLIDEQFFELRANFRKYVQHSES